MDRIVETLLGHQGREALLLAEFKIQYMLPDDDNIITVVETFMNYLRGWDSVITQSDVLNLRDELLGHLSQFLYLATLN